MKQFFALYDTSVCRTINLFSSMEKAMVQAINRISVFGDTCTGIEVDDEPGYEYVVIDFRSHDDGKLYAMVINPVQCDDMN